MAAVARAANVERTASASKERKRSGRVRAKRRIKTKVSMLSMIALFMLGLAAPFAYTNIYANLKKASYSKSEYEVLRWREEVDNQRLKVLVDQCSSYSRVKSGAVRMGMVKASHYDYIDQPQTVASR